MTTINRLRAVFMRGGTSRAVVFRREDLPRDRTEWNDIFLRVMGSPDPYGRQLDGMGGGLSSLSKICVVGPSSRADADVDYTFAQVAVGEAVVDFSGNCGNMSAAIGPYAIEEGLIEVPCNGEAVVRVHNTNTGKLIVSRFPVEEGALAADGDLEIDGVAGTAAPIRLEFLQPGGARTGRLLPTGAARDVLEIPDHGAIAASCIDAANPCVFVAAADVGKTGIESPLDLEADAEFLQLMEQLRLAGSVRMGIAADLDTARMIPGIPKIAMVCPPRDSRTLAGDLQPAAGVDVCVRMISMGQPHRAVPITGAVCLAVAVRVPGSVAQVACRSAPGPVRIGHASGTLLVDATVSTAADGQVTAELGAVYRTCRRLFEGAVLYRSSK